MWSPNNIDFQNVDVVLDHCKIIKNKPLFEPIPYTFTKLENGKKITADFTSLTPPSWLLLDHSIAVIWSMFNLSSLAHQLSIDDLKWAYEFLKGIKNKKGDNPPDVKVCLNEIQNRLINLYANKTSLKQETPGDVISENQKLNQSTSELVACNFGDFDEIAAAFGEKIIQDTTASYLNTTFTADRVEFKGEPLSPSPSAQTQVPLQRRPFKDTMRNKNDKKIPVNYFKKKFPPLEEDPDACEETETVDDEEVEKYVLSLFENEKKEESLLAKQNTKSLIPTKKKNGRGLLSEEVFRQDPPGDGPKKEKTSKRVHCVAEMRSLKFQKSMKVQDTNGEEAAYSNLKAEIKRLSFNPNVPRNEIMKFLKDWRSEQVDRLNNELKRLSSIEEFMKSINKEEVEPNLDKNSHLNLKELDTAKRNYFLRRSLLP